jgi:hypothetical protein
VIWDTFCFICRLCGATKPFCFIFNLNSTMFLGQINYIICWKRMLECSKNISTEIPILLLELKNYLSKLWKNYSKNFMSY